MKRRHFCHSNFLLSIAASRRAFRTFGDLIVVSNAQPSLGKNGGAMAPYQRTLCRLLAVLALVGVGGCSASEPEPPFETAYSAIGAQVK